MQRRPTKARRLAPKPTAVYLVPSDSWPSDSVPSVSTPLLWPLRNLPAEEHVCEQSIGDTRRDSPRNTPLGDPAKGIPDGVVPSGALVRAGVGNLRVCTRRRPVRFLAFVLCGVVAHTVCPRLGASAALLDERGASVWAMASRGPRGSYGALRHALLSSATGRRLRDSDTAAGNRGYRFQIRPSVALLARFPDIYSWRNPKSAPGFTPCRRSSTECRVPVGPGSTCPPKLSGVRRTRYELGARGTCQVGFGMRPCARSARRGLRCAGGDALGDVQQNVPQPGVARLVREAFVPEHLDRVLW
jgi:hypothetical protein